MATIKSYSDLQQSKKLAEILPLESADMEYMFLKKDGSKVSNVPFVKDGFEEPECCYIFIPCWSLAALLGVLPFIDFTTPQLIGTPKTLYMCKYNDDLRSHPYDNPVDACYEMIIRLHEQKIL